MSQYDVAVIGAGAAGLLAAASAAECGRRVLLLEKNRQPGKKILMSGGTRCNITHATDRRGIITAFREQGDFLHSALAALGPEEVVELFHNEGVRTKIEPGGKVFPVSDTARDVLNALLQRVARSGAEMALEEPLVDLTVNGGSFQLNTGQREFQCEKVIVTTGGKSYPGSGTTGDGYAWMKSLGHKIANPRPALTPITTDAEWVRELTGVTISDVGLHLTESSDPAGDRKADRVDECRGSFLFTHFGLSGPAPLDISRAITGHPQPRSLTLVCDFLPNIDEQSLRTTWQSRFQAEGKRQVSKLIFDELPKRLALAVLDQCEIPHDHRAAEIPKAKFRALIAAVKSTRVPVSGTRGFKKAEVTAGGVSLSEVDSSTMQSRLVPNLYIAGELLDLDGPIGGYNFQAAFSTAWLAGQSV